jgi:DNA-binding MurR/RpiR family transcriptional regulator
VDNNILALIEQRHATFSKSQRKLAKYIKNNIYQIPFLSINELSKNTGVSTASITRFTREISFSGYAEFQHCAGQMLQRDIIPFGKLKNVIMSRELEDAENTSFLHSIIEGNTRSLSALYTEQLEQNFQNALELILNASKIYITGARSSFAVAYYLYFMLYNVRGDVQLITNANGELSNQLYYVKPSDCLIAIGYERYSRVTCQIANYFYKTGCKIISITDSYTSPLAVNSTNVLLAPNTGAYSLVGAMTLANCLVAAAGKHDHNRTLARMEEQDRIAMGNNVYI